MSANKYQNLRVIHFVFQGSHILLNLRRLFIPSSQDTVPTMQFVVVDHHALSTTQTDSEVRRELPEVKFLPGPISSQELTQAEFSGGVESVQEESRG